MLISEAAGDPASALFRALYPDQAQWSSEAQLLVQLVNTTRDLLWIQTDDATKKPPRNRPEPIRLPWEEPAEREGVEVTRFGDAAMTLDETREWLGWVVTWREAAV